MQSTSHYTKLSEEEINDPFLAIHAFFDYSHIERIKENMWEWLKITVSGTFSTHLMNRGERYDMVYLYEHLEKLVEAVHVLYRQHQNEKSGKDGGASPA